MRRPRFSYANVMATLALFVALGGASYAAVKLPRDSVGAKQIKEDGVKASELAPNSVASSNIVVDGVGGEEIADGTVGGGDIANSSVTGDDIADVSLSGADLGEGSIGGAKIANDSIGAAQVAQADVRTPTLEECSPGTPWQAVAGLPPHYWRDNEGIVHLEGAVSCPVNIAGASIFQMPRGFNDSYDPADSQDVVRFVTLGASQSIAQIAIVKNPISTGVVYDAGSAAGTENYVSLDGLTYRSASG